VNVDNVAASKPRLTALDFGSGKTAVWLKTVAQFLVEINMIVVTPAVVAACDVRLAPRT